MAILSRVAERLYWGARYLERAEDSARIVKAHHDLMIDGGEALGLQWAHLGVIGGATEAAGHVPEPREWTSEFDIVHSLMSDPERPSSIVACVARSRENLRTTREIMPREAWQAVNGLSMFVELAAPAAVERQRRDAFLVRVIDDSRRLDGVVESTMSRSNAYRMWRLGRLVERADMTTRVLGVRAAGLLAARADAQAEGPSASGHVALGDDVEWMAVLRSLSALQMYHRAVRGPIEAEAVVRFLLFHAPFPRSVAGCFDEIRSVLTALPSSRSPLEALDEAHDVLTECDPVVADGRDLDRAMEACQTAITALDQAIHERYVVG